MRKVCQEILLLVCHVTYGRGRAHDLVSHEQPHPRLEIGEEGETEDERRHEEEEGRRGASVGIRYISQSAKEEETGECPINWTKTVLVSALDNFFLPTTE